MDILKELFGTSDELQISKTLFGGDGGSASEELGIVDNPPVSPSRDYLSSRPLPLLPAEPRPQTVATSSLIRSQSLDDLHAPPTNDVDNLFRPDVLRAQSVFPHLSETGTSNHVNLHDVPHEMPMYLLEEDEGNDEEIMRLLETTADSTSNHSGTPSGTTTLTPSNGICTGDDIEIEKVATEIVAMETDKSPGDVMETEGVECMDIVLEEDGMGPFVGMSVELCDDVTVSNPSAAVQETTSEMAVVPISDLSSSSPAPSSGPSPSSFTAPSQTAVASSNTQHLPASPRTVVSPHTRQPSSSPTSLPSPSPTTLASVQIEPPTLTPSSLPSPSLKAAVQTQPTTPTLTPSSLPSPSLKAAVQTQPTTPTLTPSSLPSPSLQTQPTTPTLTPSSLPSPSLKAAVQTQPTTPTLTPSSLPSPSLQTQPTTPTLSPSSLPSPSLQTQPTTPTLSPSHCSTNLTNTSDTTSAKQKGTSSVSRTKPTIATETSAMATTDITMAMSVVSTATKTTPTLITTSQLPTFTSSALSNSSHCLPQTSATRSAAVRPSLFPLQHTLPVSMTTRPNRLCFHTRGQSLSPPRSAVHCKPPLPPSLPLSPPLLSLPSPSIPILQQQATPTATHPPPSMQQSIEQLRAQVRLQSQKLEQVLKSFLPQQTTKPHPPVNTPGVSLVSMATSSPPPATVTTLPTVSYPSLTNTGFIGSNVVTTFSIGGLQSGLQPTTAGLQPTTAGLQPTTAGLQPTTAGLQSTTAGLQPTTAELVRNTTTSNSPPSVSSSSIEKIQNEDEEASSVKANNKENGKSDSSQTSTSSIAVQATSEEISGNTPVSMAAKETTSTFEGGSHDDANCENTSDDDVVSNEMVGVVETPREATSMSDAMPHGESPETSCHGNKKPNETPNVVTKENLDMPIASTVQNKTVAAGQSMATITSATSIPSSTATVTMATTSIPKSSVRLVSPLAPFRSTFSVCVPDMNWRVGRFGSVLGMKALPITILPPSPSSSSTSLPAQKTGEPSATCSGGAVISSAGTELQPQRPKRKRNGGGWPKGKRRKIVESDIPKPPSTAYSLFLSEQRQKGNFDCASMSQLSKTIGKMWGQLPPEAKQEYQERAVKDRERYLNDLKTHLTRKQRESSSCNLESVNDVLNKLVSTSEDNSVLFCHLCNLTFNTLHNKHCHFSSRTHTDSLLREMSRVMSLEPKMTPTWNGMEPQREECGGMGHGNETVRENGTKSIEDANGMGIGQRMESEECSNETLTVEDTVQSDREKGQKVMVEDCGMEDGIQTASEEITPLDVPNENGAVPNRDSPSDDATVQTNDDDRHSHKADEAVIEGSSPVISPNSVPNPDSRLVEWTRDYAEMLTRLKEQAVAKQPPALVGAGQTSFLNRFREQEGELMKQVDSLLSLLHSLH